MARPARAERSRSALPLRQLSRFCYLYTRIWFSVRTRVAGDPEGTQGLFRVRQMAWPKIPQKSLEAAVLEPAWATKARLGPLIGGAVAAVRCIGAHGAHRRSRVWPEPHFITTCRRAIHAARPS